MCQCIHLTVRKDPQTLEDLYKCEINNSGHLTEFIAMRAAFKKTFNADFVNNGDCTFRARGVCAMRECPWFENVVV